MKCFIPAAGLGTRMEELTQHLPKPLLEISNVPLLELAIRLGISFGTKTFIINTYYQADKIHNFLQKFTHLDIHVSHEKEKILGTGGGMRTGLEGLIDDSELFVVINPDILLFPDSPFNLIPPDFVGDALLYLARNENKDRNTNLNLVDRKVFFEEGDYFYIGLGVFRKSILNEIALNEFYDLREVFIKLSQIGELYGIEFSGKLYDVGDKELYLKYKNLDVSNYGSSI